MALFPTLEAHLDALAGGRAWRALSEEWLARQAGGGPDQGPSPREPEEAAPGGEIAALAIDLLEESGRRGARRILRRARREGAAAAAVALPSGAWAPLEAWAHFRLWRHGRALALAERSLEHLTSGGSAPDAIGSLAIDEGAEIDIPRLWVESLEAILGLALRQGYLGHARNAGRLAMRFAELAPESPRRPDSERILAALEELLDRHRNHGVPSSLLRYLARSLGHPQRDSEAAAREVVRDLSLRPEHFARARALAERLGFGQPVTRRLQGIEERGFRGHWRARRVALRLLVALFVGLLAGLAVLGLTLLRHRLG